MRRLCRFVLFFTLGATSVSNGVMGETSSRVNASIANGCRSVHYGSNSCVFEGRFPSCCGEPDRSFEFSLWADYCATKRFKTRRYRSHHGNMDCTAIVDGCESCSSQGDEKSVSPVELPVNDQATEQVPPANDEIPEDPANVENLPNVEVIPTAPVFDSEFKNRSAHRTRLKRYQAAWPPVRRFDRQQ